MTPNRTNPRDGQRDKGTNEQVNTANPLIRTGLPLNGTVQVAIPDQVPDPVPDQAPDQVPDQVPDQAPVQAFKCFNLKLI